MRRLDYPIGSHRPVVNHYNWNIVESGVKHHKPNLINVRVTLCCIDSKRETTATQVDFLLEKISSNNSIEFVCFLSSERNDE
jgi:hypothetical protein